MQSFFKYPSPTPPVPPPKYIMVSTLSNIDMWHLWYVILTNIIFRTGCVRDPQKIISPSVSLKTNPFASPIFGKKIHFAINFWGKKFPSLSFFGKGIPYPPNFSQKILFLFPIHPPHAWSPYLYVGTCHLLFPMLFIS